MNNKSIYRSFKNKNQIEKYREKLLVVVSHGEFTKDQLDGIIKLATEGKLTTYHIRDHMQRVKTAKETILKEKLDSNTVDLPNWPDIIPEMNGFDVPHDELMSCIQFLQQWCKENCSRLCRMERYNPDGLAMIRARFEEEEDAVAFKLRWIE